MAPKKISNFKNFFNSLKDYPGNFLTFLIFGILFFFLPGQNFYQTEKLTSQKPLVQKLLIDLPPPLPYPKKTTKISPPILSARSAIVMDIPSAVTLFAKNPQAKLSPASTTKIMTALVALGEYQLNQILTVKTVIKEGRLMHLVPEEQLTTESLLFGTLVHSANDAAYTLAENYPGGPKKFIEIMNLWAKKLNLNTTHFSNAVGFEQENHYISSIDLSRLAVFALNNPEFLRIVNTPKITVTDVSGKNVHDLENVNQLLGRIWGVYGVKTGWTDNAGECLVTAVERGGRKILVVILGSQDRFGETEKLIEWAFKNHQWIIPSTRF